MRVFLLERSLSLLIYYEHILDPAAIFIFPEFVDQGVQLSPDTFELFPLAHSQ